jgi:hypothetical protein
MSHNGWELNRIPERSDQKAAFHLAVPNYFDKSALAVASSLVAGPTLMLSSVFGALVEGVFVAMLPDPRLQRTGFSWWRILPSKLMDHRTGDIGGGEALFEQSIDDARLFLERAALQG